MAEIDCGGLVLVAEARRSAIGSWVAPTPEISTRNCGRRRQRGEREQGGAGDCGARNESGTMTTRRAPFASRRRQDRRPSPTTAHDMHPNDSLAVVIVAKNEAARIADCIASAAFADEVLVLDSGSTDQTAAIARAAGARVVVTDWPGYGPQVRARLFARAERLGAVARRRRAHPGRSCRRRSARRSSGRARRLSHPALVGVLRQGDAPRRLAPRPHVAPRPARQVGIHG